jgi:hypothetical protein
MIIDHQHPYYIGFLKTINAPIIRIYYFLAALIFKYSLR